MNLLLQKMMDAPSVLSDGCVICGRAWPTDLHHVVSRSQGGHDGPLMRLCGRGNGLHDGSGRYFHHGMAHHHMLHFRYEGDHWEYLVTDEPTKYQTALDMDGWQVLREHGPEYEYEISYEEPYLHHSSKKPVYFVGRDTTELPF